jgi:hypothetical protein
MVEAHTDTTVAATQVLEGVTIVLEGQEGTLEEEMSIPLKVMPYNAIGQSYVVLKRSEKFAVDKFACTLKFTVREVDPSTGEAEEDGYGDEYQLEDLEVTHSDYIQKVAVSNFRKSWEDIPEEAEQTDVYGLGTAHASLEESVEAVMDILGMQPCEGTELVQPNARSHTCLLAGCFVGFTQVRVSCLPPSSSVVTRARRGRELVMSLSRLPHTPSASPSSETESEVLHEDDNYGLAIRATRRSMCSPGNKRLLLPLSATTSRSLPPTAAIEYATLHPFTLAAHLSSLSTPARLVAWNPGRLMCSAGQHAVHLTQREGGGVGVGVDNQVLVRLYFGIDASNAIAVKVAVRSEDPEVSQLVHQIISEA